MINLMRYASIKITSIINNIIAPSLKTNKKYKCIVCEVWVNKSREKTMQKIQLFTNTLTSILSTPDVGMRLSSVNQPRMKETLVEKLKVSSVFGYIKSPTKTTEATQWFIEVLNTKLLCTTPVWTAPA